MMMWSKQWRARNGTARQGLCQQRQNVMPAASESPSRGWGGDLHKPETFVPLSVKRHSIMGTLASLVHALQCQWLFLLLFGCLPVYFSRLHPWVHDNMIHGNSLCKSLHLFFQSSGSYITPQNCSAQNMTKHDCVSLLRCGSPWLL